MQGVITTIKQNCRRCYTCVRDCPAKAIRIEEGQASVVPERCIGCGNCTMVCSQNAKSYASGIEKTLKLLSQGRSVAALLAPSFPASFNAPPGRVIGALRALRFSPVIEVAYGADLVNQACHKFLEEHPSGVHIASACPAVVEYVRKYHPELTERIMPVVSPMIATALAVKEWYGPDVRCVFIGPCVAKKAEILDEEVAGLIDEVLTFAELQSILTSRKIDLATVPESDFDPPHAGAARIYPIPGGMFDSAGVGDGILDPRLVVVSGHSETLETLSRLPEDGDDGVPLLVEALMCKGCYAGPGVKTDEHGVLRRRRVAQFAAESLHRQRDGSLAPHDETPTHLALRRSFKPDDQRALEPTEREIREILGHTNKFFPEDELNCGACGYPTCRAKAAAVWAGMAEENMCLPFIIEQSERVCAELNVPWNNLRDVHRHLINSEKLASMGQMAAGVAHELNNPLSTILLYAHILQRKLKDRDDLGHDLKLMAEESERCKRIISNLLDFARQSRVRIESVSVEEMVRGVTTAAGSHIDALDPDVSLVVDVTPGLQADMDPDQMAQVLHNLVKNAAEAMEGRSGGGELRVTAREITETNRIRFSVSDQGSGIAAGAEDKIFQPFFTTKSIGKGTGLGLPISYGIVKMHNGNIWFESKPGEGTTFFVEIPKTHASGERSLG